MGTFTPTITAPRCPAGKRRRGTPTPSDDLLDLAEAVGVVTTTPDTERDTVGRAVAAFAHTADVDTMRRALALIGWGAAHTTDPWPAVLGAALDGAGPGLPGLTGTPTPQAAASGRPALRLVR